VSTAQGAPPARPRGLGVERPADARVLVAAGVAALLTDLAVRSGAAGVAGTLLVVAVAVALVGTGRVAGAQATALVAGAAVFGVLLSLRSSPWLLPLDVVATAGLLVLGASLAGGGSLFDLPVPNLAVRAVHALAHGLAAPAYVVAAVERRRPAAILRGVAIAVPLLVVLGLLLGSADAVFAGFFRFLSPQTVIAHAVLLMIGAWGMAGLLRLAAAE